MHSILVLHAITTYLADWRNGSALLSGSNLPGKGSRFESGVGRWIYFFAYIFRVLGWACGQAWGAVGQPCRNVFASGSIVFGQQRQSVIVKPLWLARPEEDRQPERVVLSKTPVFLRFKS